jgi:FKBP-type peptidyl-prolyl cis-trans isomerase FkpA
MRHLISFLIVILLAGCQTYSEDELDDFDQQIKSYMKKNELKMTRSTSGLYYRFDEEGEGRKVKYQDSIVVVYKGKLLSGQVFDEQEEPITFAVKDMIGGWKEALLMMKKGSSISIIVPPQLGYGSHDLDDIPPHSILWFNLSVLDIK